MPLFGRKENNDIGCTHDACRRLAGLKPDAVQKQVRALITPVTPDLGTDPVVRPLVDGLVAALCIRGGSRGGGLEVLVVPGHTVGHWGIPTEQLWSLALANLAAEQLNRKTFKTNGGDDLHVLMGAGWPGASHALTLDRSLGVPGGLPNGALFTLPARNAVCTLPIRTSASVQMIPYLMNLTRELAKGDGAPPYAPSVYWYMNGGEIESLNARLEGEQDARMAVSGRFKQMMDALPQR